MERRLQKDFQIGIVEGIVQAVIQSEKEPKDVFSQIAKAIGRKASDAGKKDWNAVVRQNTIAKNPIGSTNEAVERQTRRSLRRELRHQPNSDLASMDPKRLLEYNPNLSDFTPVTRIAYAKFILSKNKLDAQPNGEFASKFFIDINVFLFLFRFLFKFYLKKRRNKFDVVSRINLLLIYKLFFIENLTNLALTLRFRVFV